MLLDSQQPLFELRRRLRETGAHKHLVEENRTDLELARRLRGTYWDPTGERRGSYEEPMRNLVGTYEEPTRNLLGAY